MRLRLLLLPFILLLCVSTGLLAQTSDNSEEVIEATLLTIEADDNSKIFFTDPESKVCYIDFSELNGYAKQLIVKSDAEVVVNEALWELPSNTIYELDYEYYIQGKYQIELYTYSTVVKKELQVR